MRKCYSCRKEVKGDLIRCAECIDKPIKHYRVLKIFDQI